jgi:ribosomal protein S18 acetylase RimI-like enzyme
MKETPRTNFIEPLRERTETYNYYCLMLVDQRGLVASDVSSKKEWNSALMEVEIRHDCSGIDWQVVSETLKDVGMAYYEPRLHKKAFENSHTRVYVFHQDKLIGFGRAISDGAYQAAIYDVAVIPELQHKGIGRTIIEAILEEIRAEIPVCTFILYASPGKEDFYRKLGFRRLKTGMAMFPDPEVAKQKGFTE